MEGPKMQRKKYSAEFKAKVALEAVKEKLTINEIASEYGVHPTQISAWKKELQEGMSGIFSGEIVRKNEQDEALREKLYSQIGQLKVEVDWLKKKTGHLM
jgi:putative transposase